MLSLLNVVLISYFFWSVFIVYFLLRKSGFPYTEKLTIYFSLLFGPFCFFVAVPVVIYYFVSRFFK